MAVTTVLKMVSNLHNNPEDLKLRSIRVSNKAFQSKVASVPGGAALLLAAGYAYAGASAGGDQAGLATQPSPGEPISAVPANGEEGDPSLRGSAGACADGAAAAPSEQFLVHPMDAPAVRRLRYTLIRYVLLYLLITSTFAVIESSRRVPSVYLSTYVFCHHYCCDNGVLSFLARQNARTHRRNGGS